MCIGIMLCTVNGQNICENTFGSRLIQNKANCNSYHVCNNGVYMRDMTCAPGLHFDEDNQFCNVPERVDCPATQCPATASSSNIVFVPSRTNCARFFICTSPTTALTSNCGPGNNFIPETNSCALAENSQCQVELNVQPEAPTVWSAFCPTNFIGKVPNPSSCHWYFFCNNGLPLVMACAQNLAFDVNSKNCMQPATATCIQNATPPACPATGIVNVPHPHTCNMFYICINGKPMVQTCTLGLIYDTNLNRCEIQEKATCNVLKN